MYLFVNLPLYLRDCGFHTYAATGTPNPNPTVYCVCRIKGRQSRKHTAAARLLVKSSGGWWLVCSEGLRVYRVIYIYVHVHIHIYIAIKYDTTRHVSRGLGFRAQSLELEA